MSSNSRKQSVFRDRLLRLLLWCLLPPLQWLFGDLSAGWVRRWAGVLYYSTWPFLYSRRRVADANLAVAFPELSGAERRHLLKRNQRFLFELGLDWLHFYTHPDDVLRRMVVSDELKAMMARRPLEADGIPKSAIFCTPHLGNWELQSRVSAITGRAGAVVTSTFSTPCLNEIAAKFRTENDDTGLIYADGAARGVLKALNDRLDIGILIDQNIAPKHGGIFVPFFGLPAATSRLPASIARRRKVQVYVVGCIKQPDGTYLVVPETLPKAAWEYASDADLTAAIMAAFERLIRRAPEQYLWLYTRWRFIPGNTPAQLRGAFPAYAHLIMPECPQEVLDEIRKTQEPSHG